MRKSDGVRTEQEKRWWKCNKKRESRFSSKIKRKLYFFLKENYVLK